MCTEIYTLTQVGESSLNQLSCCKNGFEIASIPSNGHISTTAVPLQTVRPSFRVSSVSL